jgi:hypothetical protein
MTDMKYTKKMILALGLALLLNVWCAAEENEPLIEPTIEEFGHTFSLGLSLRYMGMFFLQGDKTENFSSNLPLDFGLLASYKWITLKLSLSMFNTFNGDSGEKSFDTQIDLYQETMYWKLFFKHYLGFHYNSIVFPDQDRDIDLSLSSLGIYWAYVFNHEHHSLRSAYTLDRKQNAPSGSFLLGANTLYYNIFSGDGSVDRYAQRQHLISLGANGGYSYTWLFKNNIFLNIFAVAGLNTSINTNSGTMSFTPQLLPKAALGYHGKTWSINAVLENEVLLWRQGETLADATISFSFTITAVKRFYWGKQAAL